MVLVSYSDSDSESGGKASIITSKGLRTKPDQQGKRKAEESLESIHPNSRVNNRPPPLPPSFHSLYATNVRTSTTDDPALHGGRRRQVVHLAGNWPSHIYLEWLPDNSQLAQLDDLISQTQKLLKPTAPSTAKRTTSDAYNLTSFLRSPLSAQLPLHISLSAPLVLSTPTKDAFRDRLADAVTASRLGLVSVRPASLDLVPNFERSRWFLVLRLTETDETAKAPPTKDMKMKEKLGRLLDVCNGVAGEFGLAKLYQRGGEVGVDEIATRSSEAHEKMAELGENVVEGVSLSLESKGNEEAGNAFHISIAWMLEGVSEQARNTFKELQLGLLENETITFDRVKLKIGNVVDDIML